MKLVCSFLLIAMHACVLGACASNAGSASNSVGGAGGTDGASAGSGGDQNAFSLSSPAFVEMGPIGAQYQCGSTGASPPLSWTAAPQGTQSYAIVMIGPDANGVGSPYHWVIWDIPAATSSLPEAIAQLASPPVPPGSSQISTGTDGATWPGYAGPCSTLPMAYTFTVFALKTRQLPGVTAASTGADVFTAIQANTIAKAQLTAMASHYRS